MPVLKFKTKEERRKHPTASLIPASAWADTSLFNRKLDEQLIPLLRADSFEKALTAIQKMNTEDLCKKKQGFCAILKLGALSMDECTTLQKALNLDEVSFLCLMVALGRLDYIEAIFKQHTIAKIKELIQADNYYAFKKSCWHGHLQIAQRFYFIVDDQLLKDEMISAYRYAPFRYACADGHLDVAQWLYKLDETAKSKMIKAECYFAFQEACKEGHLEVAQWLYNLDDAEKRNMIKEEDYVAFHKACAGGHLKIAIWLYGLIDDVKISEIIQKAFLSACENGHLEIAQWLYDLDEAKKIELINARHFFAFRLACAGGHLNVAKWLCKHADVAEMVKAVGSDALVKACANGHFNTALWVYYSADRNDEMIDAAFYYACKHNRLKSVQWLYEQFYVIDADTESFKRKCIIAFREACEHGSQSTAEWLYNSADEKTKAIMPVDDNYSVIRHISCALITWLLSVSPEFFAYVERHRPEWLNERIGCFTSERLIQLDKADHSNLRDEGFCHRDQLMLSKLLANNSQECLSHEKNLTIHNLDLFLEYVKTGGYTVTCLKPLANITDQKGPTCGYHAASYVTSIWNGINEKYPYFSARTGSDKNKSFSLFSRARDYRCRNLITRFGAITDLNGFNEIFKDTGYKVHIMSFQNSQQLMSQMINLIENDCSIVFPLDNSNVLYPGLSGGRRAHYVCIIGCIRINNAICGCIYISRGNIIYTSIENLYLSCMNLKEYTVSREYKQQALRYTKGFFDDSSDTADLSGLRGKMAAIYPEELSLDLSTPDDLISQKMTI